MLPFLAGPVIPASYAVEAVDFNRDIRRILSENCFKSHGPDAKERKGGDHGLRFNAPEGAKVDLGGYRAIVPGQSGRNALLKRITREDLDDKMPPPKSGNHLPPIEVAML
jgi:hypothetical protein